jgi:copper chaperone
MTTIKVEGMSCKHCVAAVTKALEGIEGLERISVDLEKGEASFDEKKPVDPDIIKEHITKAGYTVV